MSNKERSPENVLGQVSLSRELLTRSKAFAKKKGLPWAAWVRTLIITELETTEKSDKAEKSEGDDDAKTHFSRPAVHLAAGKFASRLRK